MSINSAAHALARAGDASGNGVVNAKDTTSKKRPERAAFASSLIEKVDAAGARGIKNGTLSMAELRAYVAQFAGDDNRVSAEEFQAIKDAVEGAAPTVAVGEPPVPGAEAPPAPPVGAPAMAPPPDGAAPSGPVGPAVPANPAVPVDPAAPGNPVPADPDVAVGAPPVPGAAASGLTAIGAVNAAGYYYASHPIGGGASGGADHLGNVYSTDNGFLRVWNSQLQLVSSSALQGATGDVSASADGSVVVTSTSLNGRFETHRMVRGEDGTYTRDANFALEPVNINGTMYQAEGHRLTTDKAGNIYIADGGWTQNNLNMVLKFSPEGKFLTRMGSYVDGNREDPESWEQGRLYWQLEGIAVSDDGSKIYTSEVGNNRVQRWDINGDGSYTSTKMWGMTRETDPSRQGSTQPGDMAAPYDIGLDAVGNLFVLNTTGSQVQKFTGDGQYLTSMYVTPTSPDVGGGVAHGLIVTRDGTAISTETGRAMARA